MADTIRSRWTPTVLTAGVAAVLLGVGSGALSTLFDGFVKGLFQGAGVMLIIVGVYAVGRVVFRSDDGTTSDGWLPSRDGDR
ncbi:hypothetical protein ACHAAC_08320 [Aeromicrobium sp. CF4.19]|uniref:hypothetical protein n=1 Tax=Aeromicrobium sp. CF4.19 TaxID=3373082 RepID=UPI003EE745C1